MRRTLSPSLGPSGSWRRGGVTGPAAAAGRRVVNPLLWLLIVGVVIYASMVVARALVSRGERLDVERGVWGRRR